MRSLFWIALAMLLASAIASHHSIQLDSRGFYRGIVAGFSSDFLVKEPEHQVTTVENLMKNFQSVSDILHNLLGVRIGEMTIVLPDSWSITDKLNVTEEAFQDVQRRTLSEADFIFTDDPMPLDIAQILTMQWGECGEPGSAIQFPKKHFSDPKIAPRLLAHQWLLYRYGVFNEFGFVKDSIYPVYSRPIDGGFLDANKTKSLLNTCTDRDFQNFTFEPVCQNLEVDSDGKPLNTNCDFIPKGNGLHSSFLYAPLAVSDTDYHICDASTHDYLAPNKQNIICDNQSPRTIIGRHADFEDFPLGGRPNPTPAYPIKFKIWSKNSPPNRQLTADSQLAHIFYTFPQSFKFTSNMLGMIQKFSDYDIYKHMAMVAPYQGEILKKITEKWTPSSNLPLESSKPEEATTVNLNSIFNLLLIEFSTPSSRAGGTIVFVLSGNYSVASMDDPTVIIERLSEKLNKANIALKVLVVDSIPDKIVVRFFDELVNRLTAGRSSVHYAVSTDMNAQSRVYSRVMTFVYDTLQYATQQTHILLKRESFSIEQNVNELSLKFSIDAGFESSNIKNYWLLVEIYSTQSNLVSIGKARLYDVIDGSEISPTIPDGREPQIGLAYFKGDVLKSSREYVFKTQINQNKTGANVAISVRMISNGNNFRSFYSEAPVTGNCWVQSDFKHSPVRGYVQLTQGLNGPVFDADVTMIVRRFTTSGASAVQEFQIPSTDNGLASPDLVKNDGIYSSYLDNILTSLPDNDVVFQISARVTSPKISMKPANFGNTVMFSKQPRCCGNSLPSKSDDKVYNTPMDRVLDCGSFHVSLNDQSKINRQNYPIRDLRVYHIDPENRTVTIQWNSPFMPSSATSDNEKLADIKFFYSKETQTKLPSIIKDRFSTESHAEIELVDEKSLKRRSVNGPTNDPDAVPENILDSSAFIQDEEDGYSYGENGPIHERTLPQEHLMANVPTNEIANSLRSVTVKVKQPEAGYYFIAVQERDGSKQTRPSNVIAVYLTSNVQLDKNNAFAIEQGQMTDGPHKTELNSGSLGWEMILLICVASALILFILILVAICFTIRRRRQNSKETEVKEYDSTSSKQPIHDPTKTLDASRRAQQYYIGMQNGQQPDRSSLQSENGLSGHGSQGPASQHTSCTEVNQVHDNANHVQYYQAQYQPSEHSPTISNKQMKELNVATLLPNSWDAKDLLDHWGRVQEAKQRQEMPGMLQTTAMPAHSTSDEDTPSPYTGQHPSQTTMFYPTHHHAQAYMYDGDEFYHQAHISQQAPHSAHYSPYSNASSIWQHHQQQQQPQHQQPQPVSTQQQQSQHRMAYHNSQPSYSVGPYDESGLPEYSVVRKVPVVSPQPNPPNHANISQV